MYVYLIKSTESGYYKIGFSKNPQKRIKQLQTGSPDPLELIFSYKSERAIKIENVLHQSFSHAKKHNEWFELHLEDEFNFPNLCETIEKNLLLIENF